MADQRPTAPRYYTCIDGKVSGPLGHDTLQELVSKGMVGGDDLVAEEGSEIWKPVREVFPDGTSTVSSTPAPRHVPPVVEQAAADQKGARGQRVVLLLAGIVVLAAAAGLLGASAKGRKREAATIAEIEDYRVRYRNGGTPPLFQAASDGRADLVVRLMDEGESIRESIEPYSGEHPLHAAAASGQPDVVKLLLDRGSDPDAPDNDGGRPLHNAAASKSLEVAQLLLAAGAPLDRENRYGHLPIHCAAAEGDVEMVKLLHKAGSPLDARGGAGIHFAGQRDKNDSQLSSLLLRQGINPIDGDQPIHAAARRGKVEVVRYLLEQGIKPDAPDNNKRTPRDYAEQEGPLEGGRLEVVELLQRQSSPSQ